MEILDIVDENGNPTGQTVERERAHAEGIRHRTAHVWLARRRANGIELLLQKRSDTKDSFPGCYDISSAGHIPAGVDYIPSALRELKEELGVDASGEQLIYCGDRTICTDAVFAGAPFHDRQVSRVFALWYDAEESAFRLQETEVASVRWMPLEDVLTAVRENTIPNCLCEAELLMVKRALTAEPPPRGTIRKARPGDAGRMAEIIVYNNRKYYYPIFRDIRYSFAEFTVENVTKRFLGDADFMDHCWVYEDEVVKGFVCAMDGEVKKLYVDVFFQGEGVGTALLRHAALVCGADHLWALEKNERAIAFYQKNGFRLSGEKCFEEGTTEYLVKMVKNEE